MVKALAAGAVIIAAALPMIIATAAGAATLTTATFTLHGATLNTIGTGASGTFSIAGVGFAGDGSTTTVTSTAPGMTFTGVSETNTTTVVGSFATTSATVPGNYTLTVTDDTGPSTSTTTAGGVVVEANATVSSVTSAAPITQASPPVVSTVTITGTGFVTGATVSFQNTTDGEKLASANSATGAFTAGIVTTGVQGSATFVSATSLTVKLEATNSISGADAPAGTYNVTVVNPDGGVTVLAGGLTIIPYGVTSSSPSAIVPTVTSANTNITIAGAGFEPGAAVTFTSNATFGGTNCATETGGAPTSSSVVSATSITATVAEIGTGTGLCDITVTNPSVGAGGNGASFIVKGALGIGVTSIIAPTITATSATTALVPGAAATTVTLTGTGLSQYDGDGIANGADTNTVVASVGTGVTAGGVTLSNPSGNTGTAETFNVSVAATGATAGPFNVVDNGSNAFPATVSVEGPVITGQTPTGVAVGAPIGTVITLAGTGFTATTSGSVVTGGGTLRGIVSYVSATSMTLTLTASPNAADKTTPPTVTLTQTLSGSASVGSVPFALTIDSPPLVTGLVYTVGTDVGVGAVAQQVKINGSGFVTGATVGTFVNGNGTADPDVTATVTSVSATQIVATIAIKTGDLNLADGYTVTNTDGGVAVVPVSLTALVIGAGPTITGVSPAAATPSGTTAFTITGTGFQTGATVAATSDGTCGSTAVVSATSITVSCTLGAASATAVSLTVTNVDGGSATSAAVLTAAAPPAPKGPHATHVNGSAVTGKTVTITITGSGFTGAPKITSSAAGTTAKVTHDTGKLLTVRISTKAGKGEHTLTIRDADGKSCKINYATKV